MKNKQQESVKNIILKMKYLCPEIAHRHISNNEKLRLFIIELLDQNNNLNIEIENIMEIIKNKTKDPKSIKNLSARITDFFCYILLGDSTTTLNVESHNE